MKSQTNQAAHEYMPIVPSAAPELKWHEPSGGEPGIVRYVDLAGEDRCKVEFTL